VGTCNRILGKTGCIIKIVARRCLVKIYPATEENLVGQGVSKKYG